MVLDVRFSISTGARICKVVRGNDIPPFFLHFWDWLGMMKP